MKILVVDDDAGIRSSIRRTLTREFGADVSEGANGFDALERLMRNDFDLVLLDIHMPEMDGIKTLDVIRRSANRNAVPVVMLTGSADQVQVQEAHRLGVAGYLLKPIQPHALTLRLKDILAACSAAGPVTVTTRDALALRKQDHVVLVERDLPYLEFMLDKLSKYCHVDLATNAVRALPLCIDNPPAAIFLGGPDDFAANALFLANIRNHPRLTNVPVFALVPSDRLEQRQSHVGVDAILPRTLDEATWAASAGLVVRSAPDTSKLLDKAVEDAREYLASKVSGEVATISGLSSRWLQRWLSARIDFDASGVAWSLTVITSDVSAGRIVRAEPAAGAAAITESASVSALTMMALAALVSIRRDGAVCLDAIPHCEVRSCPGPPPAESSLVTADKWVLAPHEEILVLVRLSERQKDAHAPTRELPRAAVSAARHRV